MIKCFNVKIRIYSPRTNIDRQEQKHGSRLKVRSLMFFLFFSVFCFASYAQAIDLEEARFLALSNSKSLLDYDTSIRDSILSERSQLYSMLPQVSANYNIGMSFLEFSQADQKFDFLNPFDTITARVNLSVTQTVFQGGRSFVQRAVSSINTERIRNNAMAEYFNVLDSVDKAYYDVLRAAASLEAAQSSLQAIDLALSIAEVRFNNGMLSLIDYLQAHQNKLTREDDRNKAQRDLAAQKTTFGNLTGITGTFNLEPVSFSAYENVILRLAGISNEDADALFMNFWNIIADSNLTLANAALSSRTAELNYSNIARNYSPTISVSLSSTLMSYNSTNGFSGPSGSGSITISGRIPVDFWSLNNDIEKGKISRDTTLNNYTNTENDLILRLQSALNNIFSQAGAVLSSRRMLDINERAYDLVLERYRLSQSSMKDLSDASSSLISNQNSLNNASYTFLQCISTLRTLCAVDDEERLINMLLGN